MGPSTPVTTVAPSTPVTTAKPFAGTTINFQTLHPVTTVATDLKSKFTDKNGINVNVITVGVSEDMNEKNLLVLTGHTGSVDVLTNFVWMIGQNSTYSDELTPFVGKYNLDLSDYIQWDLDQSCRYDDAHKFVKVGGGGALYALPWDADLNMLLYRKDWFSDPKEMDAFKAKYGYDLQVPKAPDALTWKQFCDIIEFFTRPEQGIAGYAGLGDPYTFWEYWHPERFSRGEYFATDDGKPNLNSPGNLEAFNLALYYHRQGWVPKGVENMGYPEAQQMFRAGKVAVAQLWNMMYSTYTNRTLLTTSDTHSCLIGVNGRKG